MSEQKRNELREAPTWAKVFSKMANWENNSIVANGAMPSAIGRNELSFRAEDRGNKVVFGSNVVLRNLKIVFKGNDSQLIIGDDVRFTGHILVVGKGRTVTIGDRTTAQGVYILSRDADVTIGPDCMFSREIEVRSTDVHRIFDRTTGDRVNPPAAVVVGSGVWVAARAFISKGSRIADGSIVGAKSFVNNAFEEPNVIIAGTPAKVIKTNVRWER